MVTSRDAELSIFFDNKHTSHADIDREAITTGVGVFSACVVSSGSSFDQVPKRFSTVLGVRGGDQSGLEGHGVLRD